MAVSWAVFDPLEERRENLSWAAWTGWWDGWWAGWWWEVFDP